MGRLLGSLTIPDFLGFRFGSTHARVLAAALVIFSSFFYLTAVFKGVGTTLGRGNHAGRVPRGRGTGRRSGSSS